MRIHKYIAIIDFDVIIIFINASSMFFAFCMKEAFLSKARIVGVFKSRVGVFEFSIWNFPNNFLSCSQQKQGAVQLNSSSKVGDRSERACETLSRLVFSTCTGMTIAIGDSNRL